MDIFIGILSIIVLSWLAGRVFEKLGLPLFLGELLVGMLLTPIVLSFGAQALGIDSAFLNSISQWLLSDQFLVLSQLSIFFLMLLAGLDTDPREILEHRKTAFFIAILGMLIPFISGFLLVYYFGYLVGVTGVNSIYAGLIFGICLSITAFTVKTRILMEEGLIKHKLGNIMVGASLFDDVMSLILLTVVFDLIKLNWLSGESVLPQVAMSVAVVILKLILFFVVVVFIAYYIYPYLYKKIKAIRGTGFTFTLVTAFLFAVLAELSGLHFIIGAYLAGLFVSRDKIGTKDFNQIRMIIAAVALGFLAPFFFVELGIQFNVNVFSLAVLVFLILAILVAVIGKTFGAALGAKLAGMSNNESLFVGISMNWKSIFELVIAEIGRQLGILPAPLFSVIVLLVIFSNFITPVMIKYIGLRLVNEISHHNQPPKVYADF